MLVRDEIMHICRYIFTYIYIYTGEHILWSCRRIFEMWRYAAIDADTPVPIITRFPFTYQTGFETRSFSVSFFGLSFWSVFGPIFDHCGHPFWNPFQCCFHCSFEDEGCIDFPSILGRFFARIFDGFWMISPSAHPPGKTFKFDDHSDEFTCFYPSGEHVFACFPQAFLVPFVHWFWMSFGTDFGSILWGSWHLFSIVFGIEFQLIPQWFF